VLSIFQGPIFVPGSLLRASGHQKKWESPAFEIDLEQIGQTESTEQGDDGDLTLTLLAVLPTDFAIPARDTSI
jgi:hypothetical protein